MKRTAAVILPLLLAVLCACAAASPMDLSGYLHARSRLSLPLGVADLYQTQETDGAGYCLPLSDRLTLRFLAEKSGALYECRVLLRKRSANGEALPLDYETKDAFLRECSATLQAFCGISAEDAEKTLCALSMEDDASYGQTGILTTKTGAWAVRFQSHPLEAAFSVRDERLCALPTAETPVSRPLFDDTTATRTETVPHK